MQNKRRILFFIESLAGGGAEKVLVTLLKHLDPSRFDITLCCVTRVGKYLDDVPSFVDFRYLLPAPETLKGLPLLFYKIKYKLIYNLPPKWTYWLFIPKGRDVEIAYIEGNATRILAGSSNQRALKVAWVHTDLEKNRGAFVLGKSYRFFDRIVTVSKAAQKSFEAAFPELAPRVVTVYNPIDREAILQDAADNDDIPERKPGVLRLVSVGRLAPIKAYDRLLRVFLRLCDHYPQLELWMLGEGEERERLWRFILVNDLSDSVRLWGFVDNPCRFLSKCDLFVCSSLAEGLSTAATEALVLGIPVVTTDCSGMKELFGEEACGVIVDNDENALFRGLESVLDDPVLLDRMATSAKRRGAHFSLERLMPPIEALLEQASS